MIDQLLDQKIKNWINTHHEELLDQWMDLVRIPSCRREAASGAPFGKASREVLDAAVAFYHQAGISAEVEKEGHYALARYGQGEKSIGLFGHCDVVEPGDGWIYTDPFNPIIKDGYMIGRGCGDNKSGVIASLAAIRIIKELGIPLKSRLIAYMGAAEETRMPDMVKFVQQEEQPDLAFVPDSSFPCSLGEKTILRFFARRKETFKDIFDFFGGISLNAVLADATVILKKTEPLVKELSALIEGDKDYTLTIEEDAIRLVAHGIPGHAAYAVGSISGAVVAARLLKDCQNLCKEDRACMAQLFEWLEDFHGSGMNIAHEDPDFGKLTLANGIVKTEDGHVSFSTDIRFGIGLDHQEAEQRLTKLLEDHGWEITYMSNRKGFRVDPESPLPDRFTALYHELTGSEGKPYFMAGGTYSRHLKNAFTVGGSAFVKNPTAIRPELPVGHGGAHQRDECIPIEGCFQAMRVLTHYILAADKYLNQE